jgi:hypothetical protein
MSPRNFTSESGRAAQLRSRQPPEREGTFHRANEPGRLHLSALRRNPERTGAPLHLPGNGVGRWRKAGGMNWLCRIGLHRWRRICRHMPYGFMDAGFLVPIVFCGPGWYPIGKSCRCCGKRRYG